MNVRPAPARLLAAGAAALLAATSPARARGDDAPAATAPLAIAQSTSTKRNQPRPITREWNCENGRSVQVNYHPRRIREPAWLTYLGNRVEIARARVEGGISGTSADGKVRWQESGNDATLEYDGLLDQPLHCQAKQPERPAARKKR